MKAQFNSKLIRLISIILTVFALCFLFSYLLDLEQQNTLRKEQEEHAAQVLLVQEKEQEKQIAHDLALKQETARIQKVLDSRAVIEPGNNKKDFFKKKN